MIIYQIMYDNFKSSLVLQIKLKTFNSTFEKLKFSYYYRNCTDSIIQIRTHNKHILKDLFLFVMKRGINSLTFERTI